MNKDGDICRIIHLNSTIVGNPSKGIETAGEDKEADEVKWSSMKVDWKDKKHDDGHDDEKPAVKVLL